MRLIEDAKLATFEGLDEILSGSVVFSLIAYVPRKLIFDCRNWYHSELHQW